MSGILSTESRTKPRRLAVGLLLSGLLLVVVGLLVPAAVPANIGWSEQQATEHAAASRKLHELTVKMSSAPDSGLGKELSAATRQYDAIDGQLQIARSWPKWLAWGLQIAGGLAVVGGLIARKLGE